MYLLDANRYSRDPANVSGRVGEMIEKCGGQMLASRLWAEQKLAYPINGQRKGAYWLTYFRLDSRKLPELRRAAQLNNDVVRDLVLKVDDRLVDTLVSHATGTDKPQEARTGRNGGSGHTPCRRTGHRTQRLETRPIAEAAIQEKADPE